VHRVISRDRGTNRASLRSNPPAEYAEDHGVNPTATAG
jgi:hypothetical protein